MDEDTRFYHYFYGCIRLGITMLGKPRIILQQIAFALLILLALMLPCLSVENFYNGPIDN